MIGFALGIGLAAYSIYAWLAWRSVRIYTLSTFAGAFFSKSFLITLALGIVILGITIALLRRRRAAPKKAADKAAAVAAATTAVGKTDTSVLLKELAEKEQNKHGQAAVSQADETEIMGDHTLPLLEDQAPVGRADAPVKTDREQDVRQQAEAAADAETEFLPQASAPPIQPAEIVLPPIQTAEAASPAPGAGFCASCGAPAKGGKFCVKCGASLRGKEEPLC